MKRADSNGTLQITYYDAGVGAMNRAPNFRTKVVRFFDNKLGGGWGAGFEVNIEEAYTFLANNYSTDDELFIFGFSRGSSQARSLVNLIGWVGGFPSKNDAYYIPKLFTQYLKGRGEGSGREFYDRQNARNRERSRKQLGLVRQLLTFVFSEQRDGSCSSSRRESDAARGVPSPAAHR